MHSGAVKVLVGAVKVLVGAVIVLVGAVKALVGAVKVLVGAVKVLVGAVKVLVGAGVRMRYGAVRRCTAGISLALNCASSHTATSLKTGGRAVGARMKGETERGGLLSTGGIGVEMMGGESAERGRLG